MWPTNDVEIMWESLKKKKIKKKKKKKRTQWNNSFDSDEELKYTTDKCLFGKYNKNNKLTYLLTLYEDDILIGIKNKINYTLHYNINKLIEIYNF